MVKKKIVVPERIKRIRQVYKYSQSKLGEILNMPKQSISRIENGKRTVSEEEVKILAKHFNIPIYAFYKDFWDDNFFQCIVRSPKEKFIKFEPIFIDIFLKDIDEYCNFMLTTHRGDHDILKNTIDSIIKNLNKTLVKYKKEFK